MPKGLGRNPVLERDRGHDGTITGTHVDRSAALAAVEEDLGQSTISKSAHTGHVTEAVMLEIKDFMAATVGKALALAHALRPN